MNLMLKGMQVLTDVAGEDAVEETLSAAEKILDFFKTDAVKATACVVVSAVVLVLGYNFIIKPLVRRTNKR